MRLVFDTNVLVSVLLTPGGTSDRALRAAVAIGATFLYDARMLAEYRAVLSRPKFRAAITPPMIEQLLSGFVASGEKIRRAFSRRRPSRPRRYALPGSGPHRPCRRARHGECAPLPSFAWGPHRLTERPTEVARRLPLTRLIETKSRTPFAVRNAKRTGRKTSAVAATSGRG